MKKAQVYCGKYSIEYFLNQVMQEEKMLGQKLMDLELMQLSTEEELLFQKPTHCHICKKALSDERTRDHDHLLGVYRRAAHVS